MSGGGYVLPQLDDYTYDELNRIKSVTEAQLNSSGGWTFNLFTQNFNYDRLGNRTVSCSPCQPGVTGDVFTIDAATNRITAKNGTGMTYDAAGNQTYDATGNRWFDGENRMHKATQGGTTSHYVYDADGKRVRRIIGSTETWMIYGVDGELVGEYAAAASATSPQKEYGYRGGQMLIVAQTSPLEIRWTVPDHLGTPRMNIRGTGTDGGSLASVTRHDYLPFGEELFAGVGLRSSSHGYEPPADGVRQKFTGYERDGETGLDFAEARYCSSVQGRFTSLDPLMASAQVANPQTWNRYTYALNNPLRNVDPDGLEAKPVFKPYDQLTEDERRILRTQRSPLAKVKMPRYLAAVAFIIILANTIRKSWLIFSTKQPF
ncbi:MAG: RHS repeat-associated core domain-containing protein [Acidobacteriota bacterium]